MAWKAVVLVDYANNAGPALLYYADNIDLTTTDTDPMFRQGTITNLFHVQGVRMDFDNKEQMEHWLTLAAIKYGLS